MKPGLGLELPGFLGIRDRVDLARQIEQLGFSSITAPEVSDPDAFITCALVAAATGQLDVGTCIAQLGPRSVPALACAAATVENLAPGRFTLGIGVSTEAIVSGWHGREWQAPLVTTRESLSALRKLFNGEPTKERGQVVRSVGYRLEFPPVDGRPPIWLAALSPGMLGLAARETEGVWLNLLPASGVKWVASEIRAKLPAGRDISSVGIGMTVLVHETDDPAPAYDELRRILGFYVSSPVYRRSLSRHGYAAEMEAAADAFAARDWDGAVAAVSDRLISDVALIGSETVIRTGIESFFDAGLTHLIISTLNSTGLRTTLAAVAPMIGEFSR